MMKSTFASFCILTLTAIFSNPTNGFVLRSATEWRPIEADNEVDVGPEQGQGHFQGHFKGQGHVQEQNIEQQAAWLDRIGQEAYQVSGYWKNDVFRQSFDRQGDSKKKEEDKKKKGKMLNQV